MGDSEKKVVMVNVVDDETSKDTVDQQKTAKVASRRAHISDDANAKFQKLIKWWHKPSIVFA